MADVRLPEGVHSQNCGCHNRALPGDPCHAAIYRCDDHHPHPFTDLGCTKVRRAVAAALLREAAGRVNWASVTIYEHGCPACDFKQKHSHACFEAESKHLREIYELVRAQAAALEAGETGK